jgi:NADH:ubiquinone oxidoreductase subunit F (NADH-binding)/Pyruvate/2-oxoacid:ferredoxin oxidoreductase delta subunit
MNVWRREAKIVSKLQSPEALLQYVNDLKSEHSANANRITLAVGMATCGIAAGGNEICEVLQDEITKNKLDHVTVMATGCLGYCYAEPVVEVKIPGQEPTLYGEVDPKRAREIVSSHIGFGTPLKEGIIPREEKTPRIVLRNCGVINPDRIADYIVNDGYHALGKVLTAKEPGAVIAVIKKSGLRGRGGGGFSTGLKWEFARKNPSPQKYIICNADEGDPGAFMDRSVLEGDPHSVLEAMAIAGYAVGASEGVIYVRAEYPLAVKRLKNAIRQAEELGLLGENILGSGFSFRISLSLGAGAFVCGEETALIHSVEGNRGEPSVKPPFPAEKGLWEQPTCINNVETFANVCPIILNGPDWFSAIGTEKSKGTKVFALAGKINNVGLIEVPMGTTLREIIYRIGGGIRGGKAFKAVQTGGPSGGCIPAGSLDIPIDYESLAAIGSMMGSGGMIVMDEDDCMVNIARFYLEFTVDESCGKCTPCRIGNRRLFEILTRITSGKGSQNDLDSLEELGQIIKDCSLCGLGQTAPNPVLSTLKNFHDEYLAHVVEKRCPAGVCTSLLRYRILADKCIGCTLCARNCPVTCISGERKSPHQIDQSRCIKCGVCFQRCPVQAIIKE